MLPFVVLSVISHQQMNEFVAAYHAVVVLVHLLEYVLDALLRMLLVLQEKGDFIIRNAP